MSTGNKRRPRISQWKTKLLLTAGYLLCVLILWLVKAPCVFVRLLGVICPGCGMTRALVAALSLDFPAAFSFHPMFWSIPVAYLYFLFDGCIIGKKWADRAILWTIAAGFFIQWVWKLAEM